MELEFGTTKGGIKSYNKTVAIPNDGNQYTVFDFYPNKPVSIEQMYFTMTQALYVSALAVIDQHYPINLPVGQDLTAYIGATTGPVTINLGDFIVNANISAAPYSALINYSGVRQLDHRVSLYATVGTSATEPSLMQVTTYYREM